MGRWGCPLVAVGCWPWPVGWATPVVFPKVEKVAADLPLVAWCCCLDMPSKDGLCGGWLAGYVADWFCGWAGWVCGWLAMVGGCLVTRLARCVAA